MTTKPEIPKGWHELKKHDVITTDDKIWVWGTGPWTYVGGAIIGERYGRPCAGTDRHWTIIREANSDSQTPRRISKDTSS